MKFKKFILLILCLLITLTLFACKELPADEDNDSTPGQKETTNSEGDTDPNDESKQALEILPEEGAVILFQSKDLEFAQAAAELFEEKYKDYNIEVRTQEGGGLDFNKSVLEGATGKGADVFMAPHDKTIEGIQAGLYMEIDPLIVENLGSQINETAMKTVTIDNKVYGIPVSIETYVMFYNKSLVSGQPASSFEQLLAEAKEFNDSKENKFWFLSEIGTGSPIYPMLSTYGFNLFGPDGTDSDNPGFDSPDFEKGLEVLAEYKKLIPIASGDLSNVDFLVNNFIEGKTAYLIGGPWNVSTFRDAGVDAGVSKLVTYDGHQQSPFAFVQNAHVSSYTEYPKTSMLFAEFLISEDCAKLLHQKADKITSRSDTDQIDGLKDDETLLAIAEAFTHATPMPSAKRINYYWIIASSIGPAVFDGQMTPADAAKRAQEDWNSFIISE